MSLNDSSLEKILDELKNLREEVVGIKNDLGVFKQEMREFKRNQESTSEYLSQRLNDQSFNKERFSLAIEKKSHQHQEKADDTAFNSYQKHPYHPFTR